MASTIQKPLTIKKKTLTGTADNNGFLTTTILSSDAVILGAESLYINGSLYQPFYMDVMNNGGTPAQYIALKFKNWAETTISTSATVSVTIIYLDTN